jgi:hypothetical protein
MPDQQFVAVPVPPSLVPDVLQLVLDRIREQPERSPSSQLEAGSIEWADADLADFFWTSSENPRAIMALLAERPTEGLTTEDFALAIGKGGDPRGTWSVAGVLGAIQKSAKHRYGRDWPFEVSRDAASDLYRYTMPPAYAAVIAAQAKALRDSIDGIQESDEK